MPPISSRAHPLIQHLAALNRSGSKRRKAGRTVVEGPHMVREALDSGLLPVIAVYTDAARRIPESADLLERLARLNIITTEVTHGCYEKFSSLNAPEGLAAVLEFSSDGGWTRTDSPAPAFVPGMDEAGWLVAVGVQNPGNAGALARTAEAAGAAGLCLAGGVDPFGPRFLRAAMGSAFRLPVLTLPREAEALAYWRGRARMWLATASAPGAIDFELADYAPPAALCVGAEGNGLPEAWLAAGQAVRIPMRGRVESLNVAVAAGIWLFEARRRWRTGG